MDKSFRDEMLAKISPDAQAQSVAVEIAHPRIHVSMRSQSSRAPDRRRASAFRISVISAWAHVATSPSIATRPNREAMFATPEYVFKNGELVVKNGKVVKVVQGATHVVRPDFDKGDREAAQRIFRPLPHGAHGQFQAP